MDDQRRLDYLRSLGIDVWRPRGQPAADIAGTEAADPALAARESPELAGPEVMEVGLLDWDRLRQRVADCRDCGLHETRTQTVFGVGDPAADWMIVGEAPGQEEDRRGEPFVGRAGKLLDQMLLAIGLDRNSVYITNTLKCRPPNNRDPASDEVAACRPFLERQIDMIQPKIVLAVGRIAAQKLLGTDAPLGRLRGTLHFLQNGTLPLVVTYHPAYLLRSPSQKGKAWQDLCLARSVIADTSA